MLAMVPGIGIGLAGFILVAFVQMGRANVDTAEYTQQMLKVSRDQLEVSRQSLKQGDAFQKSYSTLNKETKDVPKAASYSTRDDKPEKPAKPNPQPIQKTEKQVPYQGYTIVSDDKLYRVNNAEFRQIDHAKEYIDMLCEKDDMVARIAELSAIAIPQIDPVVSSPEPVSEPMQLKASIPDEKETEADDNSIKYNGKVIEPSGDKFMCNGIPFSTLSAAKNYVDNFASVPPKILPGVKRP